MFTRKFKVGIDDGTGLRNISDLSAYDKETLLEMKEEIEFELEKINEANAEIKDLLDDLGQ
jgi:hypothetical protein